MENEKIGTSKKIKIKDILKRYGYYIVLAVLILMLSVAIIITSKLSVDDEITTPTNVQTISFSAPVLNAKIAKGYSATELQYNKVLNVWEVHKGIDFDAAIGSDVFACFDGTVKSVATNLLEGTVIEIDHGDGLISKYASLDSDVGVKVGDTVKTGDRIGKASNTATGEAENGEVHFEVWKDGKAIDPSNYLDISSSK